MCPICLSTFAWFALGGGSAAGAATLLVGWRRKGKDDGDDYNDPSDRDA
jgi:hypothetical protein